MPERAPKITEYEFVSSSGSGTASYYVVAADGRRLTDILTLSPGSSVVTIPEVANGSAVRIVASTPSDIAFTASAKDGSTPSVADVLAMKDFVPAGCPMTLGNVAL